MEGQDILWGLTDQDPEERVREKVFSLIGTYGLCRLLLLTMGSQSAGSWILTVYPMEKFIL